MILRELKGAPNALSTGTGDLVAMLRQLLRETSVKRDKPDLQLVVPNADTPGWPLQEEWEAFSMTVNRVDDQFRVTARELEALLESLTDHSPDSEDSTMYRTGMFCRNLEIIAPACQWTSGSWDFGDDNGGMTAWKKRLTKHLKRLYKKQRGRTRRVNEFSHPLPFGV